MLNEGLRIVHISPTPLVGSPAKIAIAQRMRGSISSHIVLADYPAKGALANKFIDNSIVFTDFTKRTIERLVSEADIIHIHNSLSDERARWIYGLNQTAKFVYQVHSPLREGPLYVSRVSESGLPFCAHLVVAQYHPRLYPDFIPVPNIVVEDSGGTLRSGLEKLRVLYSPTHTRGGRWNNKYSQGLEDACRSLEKVGKIELVFPREAVHPRALLEVRRSCHVSIDEISTGAFHQVSLEGLCAGNVVINRADFFSKKIFSKFSQNEMPPFLYADDATIGDLLLRMAEDTDETVRLQKASLDYFKRYLSPELQVRAYEDVYESIL